MSLPVASAGFSDALVVLGAAGLVIPTFARLRISPVIGFILVGALAGPAGLGRLVPQAPWLFFFTISDAHGIEPFAELGVVLLLFSIGLELSFGRLWAMRGRLFGLGGAKLLGGTVVLAGAALAFGVPPRAAFALGVALALSSTALVLPLVRTDAPVGRAAFAILLFEDLALVPILFALDALAGSGGDRVLATLGWGTLTLALMLVGGRVALTPLFKQAARTRSPELFLAITLLVVILAAVATAAAGLSPIVGALLAGVLIAETDYHAEVEVLVAPFQGLALGVFLLTVGMRLDPQAIAADWQRVALGTAAVILVKAMATTVLLRLARARANTAIETGLLMAAPSETTLIVLAAAIGAGVVPAALGNFWETCAALGLAVTPLLGWAGQRGARLFTRREAVEAPPPQPAGHTVVVGAGRVGRMVAEMLRRHGRAVLVVDADADAVANGRAAGLPILFGDIARAALLDRLDLGQADALVLTMDDPVQLARTTRAARRRAPNLPILARARDTRHAAELYRAGATEAVPETLEASLQLSGAVLVELGVAMGPVIASLHERRAELREALVADGEVTGEVLRRW